METNGSGEGESCQRGAFSAFCLLVNVRALQFFLLLATAFFFFATPAHGTLSTGTTYPISFVDIDGNKFSMADGHVTIVVLTTPADREEAKRLQARYDAQKISRDAKSDIFVVTDFDGTIASKLGEPAGATDFCVFVFGQTGKLLTQWHSVPSAGELAAALKKSD